MPSLSEAQIGRLSTRLEAAARDLDQTDVVALAIPDVVLLVQAHDTDARGEHRGFDEAAALKVLSDETLLRAVVMVLCRVLATPVSPLAPIEESVANARSSHRESLIRAMKVVSLLATGQPDQAWLHVQSYSMEQLTRLLTVLTLGVHAQNIVETEQD